MAHTNAVQRQLLRYMDGQGDPPKYRFGGMAPALARLRKAGLLNGNELTGFGKEVLCTESKLTFGKADPYHCGWDGWRDRIEVYLDGEHVGDLAGSGQNKRQMSYGLRTHNPLLKDYPAIARPIGIKAAKAAIRTALTVRAAIVRGA